MPRVTPPTSSSANVAAAVRAVLDRGIADSAFPGAYAVVGTRDSILASVGAGRLDWEPSPPTDDRTIWDLASLTKVVGMTTAMMQLWERGLDLEEPVQRYLPTWTGPGKDAVTVRHLLTHSSGLPAYQLIYRTARDSAEALAQVYAAALDTVAGARMVYSDLGAILLGQIIRRVSGEPLDKYLRDHIFAPLGMIETSYRPDSSLRARIAPTERDPWRQRHLRGEVHDENAYALGGVSSHAGLFSTAADLTRFARMLLNGGTLEGVRILAPATIDTFTAVQDRAFSNRALGWEVPNGQNSAGHLMSARAFGHTGFTGTSIWIDRDRGAFVLLLTNRVNPTRENRRISGVRVALADSVLRTLDATRATKGSTLPSGRQR